MLGCFVSGHVRLGCNGIRYAIYYGVNDAQQGDLLTSGDFYLHPRLAADTAFVADWTLSRVMLMNDARYPWLILVPRRGGATELFDLAAPDRATLIEEISRASQALKELSPPAKINIGALGNLVPQFHVHVVARSQSDAAWPGPVWGQGVAEPYEPGRLDALAALVRTKS